MTLLRRLGCICQRTAGGKVVQVCAHHKKNPDQDWPPRADKEAKE